MHTDIYGDTDTTVEPLWLLAPASDAQALNDHDRSGPPTLRGLRQTAERVLDAASQGLGLTRAQAHRALWPQALSLTANAYTQVREEGACRTLEELRERVLAHTARTTCRESVNAVETLRKVSRPQPEDLRPFARSHYVRFLAGTAIWLPLIGQHTDTLRAEGPTVAADPEPAKGTVTVLTLLVEGLLQAGFDPEVFHLGSLQCVQAHRIDGAPAVIYNGVDQSLEIPLRDLKGLTAQRYEPGSQPALGEACPGEVTHYIWNDEVCAGEAIRDLAEVIDAVVADSR